MNLFTYIPNDGDATSFYRAHQPLAQLRHIMPDLNIFHSGSQISPKSIAHMDMAFIQRPSDPGCIAMLELFQENGLKIWVDYDDNLFDVPNDNPAYPTFSGAHTKEIMMKMIREADLVTVSTQALADQLDDIVKRLRGYHVVPNAYNDYLFKDEMRPGSNNVVTWRGTQSHQKDLAHFGVEIIQSAHKFRTQWAFLFMGYEPWFMRAEMPDNTIFSGPTDIMKYYRNIKQISSKVFIVPLLDHAFNHSKSNIAWIEATMAGAVTVAPNWNEWQKPGVILYNSPKTFESGLNELLKRNDEFFRQSHALSKEYIMDNLRLSKVNEKRKELLEDLL